MDKKQAKFSVTNLFVFNGLNFCYVKKQRS
jgi:hypothetical protein